MADTKISAETAAATMRGAKLLGIEGTPLNRKFPASLFVGPPQGRLTLTTAVPVLISDVTAATTVYYALYNGNLCPIYDGTAFAMEPFTELSLTLDATNTLSGKNYDCFVANDSGTIRLVYGPAWSSDTARGTGAGTTELERKNGIWTNKVSMTGRYASGSTITVGANQGTYVGTFRASANGQTQVKFGSKAAGGGEAWLGVWNAYNRIRVAGTVLEDTNSWSYTTATWRAADASNTNRVSFVVGIAEDGIEASYSGDTGSGYLGVGLDSTTAPTGVYSQNAGGVLGGPGFYKGMPSIGFHYLQALESGTGSANTFYGDNGGSLIQSGLTYAWTN